MNDNDHRHVTGDELEQYRDIGVEDIGFDELDFIGSINSKLQSCIVCEKRYKFFNALSDIMGDPPPAILYEEENLAEKLKTIIKEKSNEIKKRKVDLADDASKLAGIILNETAKLISPREYAFRSGDADRKIINIIEKGDYLLFDLEGKTELIYTVPKENTDVTQYELTLYNEVGEEFRYPLKTESGHLYTETEELEEGRYGAVISEVIE